MNLISPGPQRVDRERRAAGSPASAMNLAPSTSILSFGDCQLDLKMRMLWRRGVLQAVEPRVFDLLELLVESRGRVVSRDELATKVWVNTPLTPSALHRAMTVLRRMIGSDRGPSPMIRTVHRVGYQFVAPVSQRPAAQHPGSHQPGPHQPGSHYPGLHTPGPQTPADADIDPPSAATWAVGLLWRDAVTPQRDLQPLQNRFGQALAEAVRRLGLPEPALSFLETGRWGAALETWTDGTIRLDAIATVDLHADADGFWLEWRVRRADGSSARDCIREARVAPLLVPAASGVAAAIAGRLDAFMGEPYDDEFSLRTHARACALLRAQDWARAERLFDLLATAHPGDRAAARGKLMCMLPLDAQRAVQQARILLAEAQADGDQETGLVARFCIATGDEHNAFAHNDPELMAAAQRAIDAMAAVPRPLPEFELRLIAALASETALEAPLDGSGFTRQLRSAEVFRISGDLSSYSKMMGLFAALAVLRDEVTPALDLVAEALRVLEPDAVRYSAVSATATLALLKMRLGEVEAAAELVDQVLGRLAGTQVPSVASYILSGLAYTLLEVGDRRRLRQVMVLLQTGLVTPLGDGHPALLATRAALELSEGQSGAAVATLWQMVEHPLIASERGVRASWLLLLLRLELSRYGTGRAQSCLTALHGYAGGSPSPLLEAWQLRTRAAQHHRAGRHRAALGALMEAMAVAPGGMVQALTRLDAAWLLCEQGDTGRAHLLWAGSGAWGTRHPIGLAVKARLLAQQAAQAEAVDWQSRALSAWAGSAVAVQVKLLQRYQALASGAMPDLPKLSGFASEAWWG